jgi:glycosyltransferase involved in cell wall biosynthesis
MKVLDFYYIRFIKFLLLPLFFFVLYMPIASILIPVFNRAELLGRAISSALAQTVSDIEIIVFDNASTDESLNVALYYSKNDPRVKVWKNNSNIGPVNNWKACVEKATATYSKILFSDDLIAPNYLEKTIPHLISSKCGFVFSPVVIGDAEWIGSIWYRAFHGDIKIDRTTYLKITTHLDGHFPVSPGSALFRTEDLKTSILNSIPDIDHDFSNNGAGVDWLIFCLIALKYEYVFFVDEPLSFFRIHSGSITIQNDPSVGKGYDLAKQWLMRMVNGL